MAACSIAFEFRRLLLHARARAPTSPPAAYYRGTLVPQIAIAS
jgi:hypothetical protein